MSDSLNVSAASLINRSNEQYGRALVELIKEAAHKKKVNTDLVDSTPTPSQPADYLGNNVDISA